MKRRRHHLLFAVALGIAMIAVIACGQSETGDYPIVPNDELVSAGRAVYGENCAICHGDDRTPPLLPAAPPHTELGHTWHHADRQLVEWILDGVPLAEVMPQFRGTLTEDEARAAVAYIKTFWSDEIIDRQIAGSAQYESQLAGTPLLP